MCKQVNTFLDKVIDKVGNFRPGIYVNLNEPSSSRAGGDNDTRLYTEERRIWNQGGAWIDPRDGFNYGDRWKSLTLPILAMAASKDPYLGNVQDAHHFCEELGYSGPVMLLGKKGGCSVDYTHVGMLTQSQAKLDHFPKIVEFIQKG